MSETVYYNVLIRNNESIDADNDPEVSYAETKSTAILKDAAQYQFSIVRFQLNGVSNLPLFCPRVQIGQSNPDLTIYKFSVQFLYQNKGGPVKGPFSYKWIYTYVPERAEKLRKPNAPIIAQDFSSEYYN